MVVFSKDNCVPCAELKAFLKFKQVDYKEEPISEHTQELMDKGFLAAPVVKVGDTYLTGTRNSYSRIMELSTAA